MTPDIKWHRGKHCTVLSPVQWWCWTFKGALAFILSSWLSCQLNPYNLECLHLLNFSDSVVYPLSEYTKASPTLDHGIMESRNGIMWPEPAVRPRRMKRWAVIFIRNLYKNRKNVLCSTRSRNRFTLIQHYSTKDTVISFDLPPLLSAPGTEGNIWYFQV